MKESKFFENMETKKMEKGGLETPELREIKKEYGKIINERDEIYKKIVKEDPSKAAVGKALERHNNVVLHYAIELIKNDESLNEEEKTAAIIGTILHDAGKLDSDLLEHHLQGAKRAREILNKFKDNPDVKFYGQILNENIIQMAIGGVLNHMNHPFLVAMKKEKFPEPENEAEKIVFSADMLANIGFKNMAFNLTDEKLIAVGQATAKAAGITFLQAAAESVIGGIKNLKEDIKQINEEMLTESAKEMFEKHVENVSLIFKEMSGDNIFDVIQKEAETKYPDEGNKNERVSYIIQRLNKEIAKAGEKANKESPGLISEIDLQHYLV